MYKRITTLILSGLLIFSVGCGKVEIENNEQPQEQMEQQNLPINNVDLELLEQEYVAIMNLADRIITIVSENEQLSISDALNIIEYLNNNRIEPTQYLTIKLDGKIDQLLEKGMKYTVASKDNRAQLESEIYKILLEIEQICNDIEFVLEKGNLQYQ